LSGTLQYYGNPGSLHQTAYLNASLDVIFSTSGTKALTAIYSGDANYSAVTTPSADNVSVFYPPNVTLSASATSVSSGSTVILTAQADAGVKSPSPTGTFTFSGPNGVLTGNQTISTTKDSSGNAVLQATLSTIVNSAEIVNVQYSGDTNFFGSFANSIFITVPDFSLIPTFGNPNVTAGQPLAVTLNVEDDYGFNGTVSNFSCSGLPPETTCTFSPSSVTGSGSTTITIQTTPVGQLRKKLSADNNHAPQWPAQSVGVLLAACLFAASMRNRHSGLIALFVCALLIGLPSCGGGGGGGGTPPPVNNPAPSISSLLPSELAAGSTDTTLIINGSGFIPSSSVLFNGAARGDTFISQNQLSIQLGASDLVSMGALPVQVSNSTPGGGQSPVVNLNVVSGTPTGNFPVTVTASGATFTHSITFTLTVQ
jgi:hypothetical protein